MSHTQHIKCILFILLSSCSVFAANDPVFLLSDETVDIDFGITGNIEAIQIFDVLQSNNCLDLLKQLYTGNYRGSSVVTQINKEYQRLNPELSKVIPTFFLIIANLESTNRDLSQTKYAVKSVTFYNRLNQDFEHVYEQRYQSETPPYVLCNNTDDGTTTARNLDYKLNLILQTLRSM